MLFSTFFPAVVQANVDESQDIEIDLEDYEVKTQGLTMSPKEFANAFGGEPETRFMPFNLVSTELTMHNIVINGSHISLDLILSPVNLLGTVIDVEYSAYVTRLNGNQNELIINVIEHFEGGWTNELSETVRIDNNGSGTFEVGNYQIFVDTQGNDRIHEIRLESDGSRVLPINGTIYNGNREGAVVIEIENDIDGYEVLLFEINTTPETNNLLLPSSHNQGLYELPHTKIYLLDEVGQLHLFELETAEALLGLQPEYFETLGHLDDFLWTFDFVEYTVDIFEDDELTDELIEYFGLSLDDEYETFTPFGLSTWTTDNYGTVAFVVSVTVGNDRTVSSSRPAMRRRHNNIGRNATNFFDVEFRIVESTRLYVRNGTTWRHWRTEHGRNRNIIDYRNVSVRLQLGDHTQINNFTTHGRARNVNRLTNQVRQAGHSIGTTIMSAAGVPSSAQTALNLIAGVVRDTSRNVTLGSQSTYARTGRWTLAGNVLPSQYRFYYNTSSNNGHRFHLQVNAGRRGSGTNIATVHGSARIEFDVFISGTRNGARRNIARAFTYTVDRRN